MTPAAIMARLERLEAVAAAAREVYDETVHGDAVARGCVYSLPALGAALRALDSTPSSTVVAHSGADTAAGEGASDERCERVIPSAECTDYPVWIIVSGKLHDRYHAGPWFSREAATEHLVAASHRYPRGAIVYCHTGHMSWDYRHLCETGTLPAREVSDG